MEELNEMWKEVAEYEGMYEVSNYGRVRSLDRKAVNGRRLDGKELRAYEHNGYLKVKLNNGTKTKGFMVHRLVAQAFLLLPSKKYEVHHIDHDKKNNHVSNLMWVTRSENIAYSYEFYNKNQDLNTEDVKEINQ